MIFLWDTKQRAHVSIEINPKCGGECSRAVLKMMENQISGSSAGTAGLMSIRLTVGRHQSVYSFLNVCIVTALSVALNSLGAFMYCRDGLQESEHVSVLP